MPVTPTSYEAQVSAGLVAMLAASATFTGAGGGRAAIVEDDGGNYRAPKNCDGGTLNTAALWAAVRIEKCGTTLRAWNTYAHAGEAQILVVVPRATNESSGDLIARGRNLGGGIRDDMNALWGAIVSSTPAPASGDIEVAGVVIADDSGPLAGSAFIHLTISFRDIP